MCDDGMVDAVTTELKRLEIDDQYIVRVIDNCTLEIEENFTIHDKYKMFFGEDDYRELRSIATPDEFIEWIVENMIDDVAEDRQLIDEEISGFTAEGIEVV